MKTALGGEHSLDIGKRIKEVRKERKITLKELSDKIGYSSAYISQIENGKRGKPSHDFLQKVSNSLDVSIMYLTTGKKSLGDMEDEELRRQFVDSEEPIEPLSDEDIKLMMKGFRESVQKELSQLAVKDLSHTDAQLIYHLLQFINESNEKDKETLDAFLLSLNRTLEVANEDANQDKLLEEINLITDFIKKFLKRRSGYIEKSD